jgi:3-oxoacyl-[acyl-carrier-protein] synthase II
MTERIVITGMGAVTSIGLSVNETWQNALKGVSGVAPITLFDTNDFLVKVACEVKGFNPEEHIPAKEARRRDRYEQFATVASKEAIHQAGLQALSEEQKNRVGVTVSSAIGGIKSIQDAVITMIQEGPRRVSPFVIPMLMSNGAAGMVAIDYGFKGPCLSVGSACASGSDGIGLGWMLLRSGVIDVAVTGGSEATITPIGVSTFDRLGAMSRRGTPDEKGHYQTPQPFDLHRDGLVMGEGAAVLILERESHARARGAEILAELAGYAATADAYHITAPDEDGAGGGRAIRLALEASGINLGEVDYINAHGTATPLNDQSETRAIKTAFGKFAYNIPISSTKAMTGHMIGATGALEAIICVKAVCENAVPPTINYQTPDPECDLDYVPNEARAKKVNVALSNAFGFGGHNAVLAVRKYS